MESTACLTTGSTYSCRASSEPIFHSVSHGRNSRLVILSVDDPATLAAALRPNAIQNPGACSSRAAVDRAEAEVEDAGEGGAAFDRFAFGRGVIEQGDVAPRSGE